MIALSQTQFNDLMLALTKIVNQAARLQLAQNVATDGVVATPSLDVAHANIFTLSLPSRPPNSNMAPSNRKRCMVDGLPESAKSELEMAVAEYRALLHTIYASDVVPDVYFQIKKMIVVHDSHRTSHTGVADTEKHSLSLRLNVKAIIERLNQDAGTNFKLLKEGIVRNTIHSNKCVIDFQHIPKREIEFTLNDACKYFDAILMSGGFVTEPYLAPAVRGFFNPKNALDFAGQSTITCESLPLAVEVMSDDVGVTRTSVFN